MSSFMNKSGYNIPLLLYSVVKKHIPAWTKKSESPRLAAYGLLEKANAFPSCDAYAAEAFLVERFD